MFTRKEAGDEECQEAKRCQYEEEANPATSPQHCPAIGQELK